MKGSQRESSPKDRVQSTLITRVILIFYMVRRTVMEKRSEYLVGECDGGTGGFFSSLKVKKSTSEDRRT